MDFIYEIKNWLELKIRLWTKKDKIVFKQGEMRWALLNQARILDNKRLTNKIDFISKADFGKVKKRFIEFYSS